MERSWLIQRLSPPTRSNRPIDGLSNAFAFGGGLRNGGLSAEAMSLIDGIFRFDYMGSAEFEWGAVPAALNMLAKKRRKLRASTIDVDGSTIYVICHRDDVAEVAERIRGWASEPYNDLKEQTCLSNVLRVPTDNRMVCGWLELENGFFFFTDASMFRATAILFGVAAETAVA